GASHIFDAALRATRVPATMAIVPIALPQDSMSMNLKTQMAAAMMSSAAEGSNIPFAKSLMEPVAEPHFLDAADISVPNSASAPSTPTTLSNPLVRTSVSMASKSLMAA